MEDEIIKDNNDTEKRAVRGIRKKAKSVERKKSLENERKRQENRNLGAIKKLKKMKK